MNEIDLDFVLDRLRRMLVEAGGPDDAYALAVAMAPLVVIRSGATLRLSARDLGSVVAWANDLLPLAPRGG